MEETWSSNIRDWRTNLLSGMYDTDTESINSIAAAMKTRIAICYKLSFPKGM